MPVTTQRTPAQVRDDRNARRRAQRRANGRHRRIRHAANEVMTWGTYDGDRPAVAQVITKATAMYGNYRQIKDQPITEAEVTKALDELLSR